MEFILGIIIVVLFFWLLVQQHFILTAVFAVVIALLTFFRFFKVNNRYINDEDDFHPFIGESYENNIKPLPSETTDEVKSLLYKLSDTAKLQVNIEAAIEFDNKTSLDNNNFKGLDDREIISGYRDGTRLWQYDDEYGIGNFKLDDSIKHDKLAVYAQTSIDYKIVGYITDSDSKYVDENRDKIKSIRLIYRGGYYKYVALNTVETAFDNYVLMLAICYNK